MPGFLENWVEDTARNRLVREESPIQSEWPAHSGSAIASGFLAPAAASGSLLMSVPSSRWFKPKSLWLTNNNTVINQVNLYVAGSAASCSATIGGIWMQPRETAFIDLGIGGVTVGGGDIYASTLAASMEIRIAGILLASGPEN